jgi:hypothetical protein
LNYAVVAVSRIGGLPEIVEGRYGGRSSKYKLFTDFRSNPQVRQFVWWIFGNYFAKSMQKTGI